MLLGITSNLQEKNRVTIKKQISLVTTFFIASLLLPMALYALFHMNIIPSKPAYNADIQEPVAKVITKDGTGTAFLISPTLLLTARHVVEKYNIGDEVDLIFEQSATKLQVKGKIKFIASTNYSPTDGTVTLEYFLTDVAVIEVAEITEIQPLVLGESDVVNLLDDVILIGYPNGDYSISKGSINNDKFQSHNLFKLDATSNPGNSGGPCVLKIDNSVIGILVGGSGPFTQGENIAVKIDDIKKILDNARIVY